MPPAMIAALGGGAAAATMYLTVLTGSPGGMLLVYLAPLPLFLAGLAFGPTAALVASGTATVVITAVIGGLVLPATFILFSVAPVLLVVRQTLLSRRLADGAIQWYPPGSLLLALTGLGVTAIIIAALGALAFGGDGGLKAAIQSLLSESLAELFRGGALEAGNPGVAAAEVVAQVFPGVVGVSWLIMVVVNGLLAQSLLARFNRLMRPPLRMSDLELPAWSPLVLALTIVGAVVVEGQVGFALVNLAIVMAVPFFFAGLGVVHAFANPRRAKVPILIAFYLLLSLLAWPVLAVIGLGVIEQWAGLRGRFAASGPDRGET